MEEFVQSSGEHGIVVFSLGSMVDNLTDEKSNVIGRALSQLPQKVNFLSSLKQLALFFVTSIAYSEPFMFLLAWFLSASLLDVPQPGSWALQKGRLLSHLMGSSGVSPSLNQMMWKCVHRTKYKTHSLRFL